LTYIGYGSIYLYVSTRTGTLPAHDLTEAARAALANDPVASLIQIDLDRFADINETAGREVGDRVLKAAVTMTRAAAKAEGWTYIRIGGDEFALLAPSLSLEQAFIRAERLRAELGRALAEEVPEGLSCTASIGVANVPRDAKTPEELLRKADLALYSAKEQGGDAVGLTPGDEMILKSSYYGAAQLGRLKALAERLVTKEAVLLREALDDLLRKYDRS
jgi:diguanylate cyclase (GGDEF)-like protein